MMYSQQSAAMAAPQKPETFMLSSEAQQALPHDAQVALQQVDNREIHLSPDLSLWFRQTTNMARSQILSHLRAR